VNNVSYIYFLKDHGRPLTEINPGSDELALELEDALEAIKFLENTNLAILGGDILSDISGKLIYTYENWYCEKMVHEAHSDYCNRSYMIAKNYISNLIKKNSKKLYVVLVTQKV
jgi:hypothetical protein